MFYNFVATLQNLWANILNYKIIKLIRNGKLMPLWYWIKNYFIFKSYKLFKTVEFQIVTNSKKFLFFPELQSFWLLLLFHELSHFLKSIFSYHNLKRKEKNWLKLIISNSPYQTLASSNTNNNNMKTNILIVNTLT